MARIFFAILFGSILFAGFAAVLGCSASAGDDDDDNNSADDDDDDVDDDEGDDDVDDDGDDDDATGVATARFSTWGQNATLSNVYALRDDLWVDEPLPTTEDGYGYWYVSHFDRDNSNYAVGRTSLPKIKGDYSHAVLRRINDEWLVDLDLGLEGDDGNVTLSFFDLETAWAGNVRYNHSAMKDELSIFSMQFGVWDGGQKFLGVDELEEIVPVSNSRAWAYGRSQSDNLVLFFDNGLWSQASLPDNMKDSNGFQFIVLDDGRAISFGYLWDYDLDLDTLVFFSNNGDGWSADEAPLCQGYNSRAHGLFSLGGNVAVAGANFSTQHDNHYGVLLSSSSKGNWTTVDLPFSSADWGFSDMQKGADGSLWLIVYDYSNNSNLLLNYDGDKCRLVSLPDFSQGCTINRVNDGINYEYPYVLFTPDGSGYLSTRCNNGEFGYVYINKTNSGEWVRDEYSGFSDCTPQIWGYNGIDSPWVTCGWTFFNRKNNSWVEYPFPDGLRTGNYYLLRGLFASGKYGYIFGNFEHSGDDDDDDTVKSDDDYSFIYRIGENDNIMPTVDKDSSFRSFVVY